MLMVIFTKVIGFVIEPRVKEDMYILTVLNMMENGLKINNTVKVQKYGLIRPNIPECINMVKNMEKVCFSGRMDHHIKEILIITTLRVMEFISGQVNIII